MKSWTYCSWAVGIVWWKSVKWLSVSTTSSAARYNYQKACGGRSARASRAEQNRAGTYPFWRWERCQACSGIRYCLEESDAVSAGRSLRKGRQGSRASQRRIIGVLQRDEAVEPVGSSYERKISGFREASLRSTTKFSSAGGWMASARLRAVERRAGDAA
ncbi:hypothetical protein K402DRAFT_102622 [Aulographum hederae CBS 113979]|uniref:Secreted protein n=1 Tax=Aulographum hederae CBS 113979 TaxID=1176131 RepID=A0A6G1GY29_9PEZI|nr:hypothetical protein K402DRAFT_102622 [Aulographum hederae CBS 113979]